MFTRVQSVQFRSSSLLRVSKNQIKSNQMKAILGLTLCTIGLHTDSMLVGAVCIVVVLSLIFKSK
jgi:succinate-acetate transporter protein